MPVVRIPRRHIQDLDPAFGNARHAATLRSSHSTHAHAQHSTATASVRSHFWYWHCQTPATHGNHAHQRTTTAVVCCKGCGVLACDIATKSRAAVGAHPLYRWQSRAVSDGCRARPDASTPHTRTHPWCSTARLTLPKKPNVAAGRFVLAAATAQRPYMFSIRARCHDHRIITKLRTLVDDA